MESITGLINKLVSRRDWEKPLKGWQAVEIWPRVAGKNICLHSKAKSFSAGILFVVVDNPVWSYHLSLLKEELVEKLNSLLQGKIVTDIIFRVGMCREEETETLPKEFCLPDPDQTEEELSRMTEQEFPIPAINKALLGYIRRRQMLRVEKKTCPCCQEPFVPDGEELCPYCLLLLSLSQKEIVNLIKVFPDKTPEELQQIRPDLGETSLFKYIKERGA